MRLPHPGPPEVCVALSRPARSPRDELACVTDASFFMARYTSHEVQTPDVGPDRFLASQTTDFQGQRWFLSARCGGLSQPRVPTPSQALIAGSVPGFVRN